VTNYAALINGWIDMFVDYTGTGCMLFNIDFHDQPHEKILKTLNEICIKRHKFEWMQPLGTKTNYCVVMTQSLADEQKIEKVSDINKLGLSELRFCADYEFMNRSDGYTGLKSKYKLRFAKEEIVSYDDRYNYLATGKAEVSIGHSTDPAIRARKLKILKDDKNYFPDYLETPLVRTEALESIEGLREILEALKDLELTNDDLTTRMHDYENNPGSLSGSVKGLLDEKMAEGKLTEVPQAGRGPAD
jgi:glycine betaine/choline ABC-type transport system substrate-binding protein